MFNFLGTTQARVLTVVLLVHIAAFYGLSRTEPVRQVTSLSLFPAEINHWSMVQEGVVDKETMEVLKADDVITRLYASAQTKGVANLFVAYFQTQRNGKTPHSPKNCLPGSGWLPVVNDRIKIDIAGEAEPLDVNRFVVARGEDKSVVLYWYQTYRRSVASEYQAKIYTVLDSLRYNRSDAAVVKVTVLVRRGQTEEDAFGVGVDFIRSFYPKLKPYFPA
jgi:EpsI family protein